MAATPGRLAAILSGALALTACGGDGEESDRGWRHFRSLYGAVDVGGPRADGRLVAVARFRLFLVTTSGKVTRFARGRNGYAGEFEGEPYLAVAPEARLPRDGCSFHRDEVYVLQPGDRPAVLRVSRGGRARRFADLPRRAFPNGIAFDRVGTFGHRLLVTASFGMRRNELYAIDCRGLVRTLARRLPKLEGGMEVAPRSFGRFAGQLVAPDEFSGRVYAIDSRGRHTTLARPDLPSGRDRGVESLGFAPARLARRDAYLSDLNAGPDAPSRGTGSILRVSGRFLAGAGVRRGDLIVVTEAGARTVAIRCRRRCRVRELTSGPSATHAEGHLIFAPARPSRSP